jgi:hypothetical protein
MSPLFIAACLFGVVTTSATIVTLASLRFVERRLATEEDDERCPEIREWHPVDRDGKINKERISNVTRCTLRIGHQGPHHTPHPTTEETYWWQSKEKEKKKEGT